MAKPLINIDAIRSLVSPESFSRGRRYYRDGAVRDVIRRGEHVTADVEGSDPAPYLVSVRLHDRGVADAKCTCPYDWGGYCKHIVAVLLTLSEQSRDVVERPSIPEQLKTLDKTQLLAVITRRLEIDPGLANWLDAELALLMDATPGQADGSKEAKRRSPVDPEPIRIQAEALLRGRYRQRRHWDDFHVSGTEAEIGALVDKARPFITAGDGRNALRVLEAIADVLVTGWIEAGAADEHVQDHLWDLDHLFAEASLSSDLAADERDDFAIKVERWHRKLTDYGLDDCFAVALRALEAGWDEPTLQAVLAGQGRRWPPRDDHLEMELTEIRLRVLAAANRCEDYLRLAKAAGAHAEHASMLARLGRVRDAIKYARKHLRAPSEARDVAKVLRELGSDEPALEVAEWWLSLQGTAVGALALAGNTITDHRPHGLSVLAHWLRDYAGAHGRKALALKAATVAFQQTHVLADFRAAETWAKGLGPASNWQKVRATLLAHLDKATHASDRTLIYLEEGLIDDAVRSAGRASDVSSDPDTLLRLMDAAAASHSDWVIEFAVAKASAIMDANRASHYREAATWLTKAALAFEAAGREDEWLALLDRLIDRHRRKYKLKPLLEALR